VRRHKSRNRLAGQRRRWSIALVVVTAVVLQPAAVSNVLAQEFPASFREAVSVNVQTQVVKKLETAREHILEGQWDTAVSILQELIDSGGDTLLPVEPGRYSNTADRCHLLISRFPDIGLSAYRNRVDAQSQEWFETGRQSFDEKPLLRVVNSAFNSSFGDDSLWLLGELAFEQGRFALARQYWSLLVPSVVHQQAEENSELNADIPPSSRSQDYLTHPDPAASREEVLARLVLCSIFEGDIARAKSELAVCNVEFPDASGTLAGRTGKFVAILADVLVESGKWSGSQSPTRERTAPGGRLSRSGLPEPSPQTREIVWRRPIPRNRFQGPASRTALESEAPPPFFPLATDNAVFVCGADSVFAFDLATGRPRWAIDDNDDGSIFSNVLERPITPHLPSAGMAWYSLCLSEGRLYARMGPPVMRRSRNEGNSFSEIIGLDVAEREGELVFQVTSDVLDADAESPEATSWSFEGTPLVADGRVYVSARRGFPEDETIVACFDAVSSRLLWKRRVCASLKTAGDRFNLIGQNLLTLGDGRLFLSTGTGAIAALDAASGRILWVVTYQPERNETPQEISDPRRHGLTPCVYHRGTVYAAPDDTNIVYALDATTGQPVWRQQYPDQILHIVGVVEGRLILSGQSVWAVDARTGASAWPERIGFADPAGRGFGRPALSHDFLYWPTRDEILRIDHRRGSIVERIRLREDFGQSGGNLVIAGGKLLIAQPEQLTALGPNSSSSAVSPESGRSFSTPSDRVSGSIRRSPGMSEDSLIRNVSFQAATVGHALEVEVLTGSSKPTVGKPDAGKPTVGTPDDLAERASLWPARRAWQVTLPEKSSVWFPDRLRDSQSVGAVVAHGENLQLRRTDDGQTRWSISISEPFTEVVCSGDVLVLAGKSAIVARDLADGRLAWRRLRDSDDSSQLQITLIETSGNILAVSESQAVSLDAQSGDELWSWPLSTRKPAMPAATRFPAAWVFGKNRLLFRAAGTSEYGLIDVDTGELIRRGSLSFTPLKIMELPATGREPRTIIAGLDSEHQVHATQLSELGIRWKHKPSSTIHAAPVILTDAATVIVVDDKQFATRLDAGRGTSSWRRPISLTPLDNVELMTAIDSKFLFAASESVVRAFSLDDGSKLWETYPGSGPWTLQLSNDNLICIHVSETDGRDNAERSSQIVALNASTGQIVQRLRFESELRHSDVSVQAGRCIVRAGDQLVGLIAWPHLETPDGSR
jgi:outer membrane protein assembly factor BamB